MAESDIVCSWDDTWGFIEGFIIWGGRHSLLLHRFRVRFGWVGLGAMEMPRKDVSCLFQYSTIEFLERRILSMHDGEYDIVRIAQRQHGGTTLGLVGNWGVTTLHSSITFRKAPAIVGGDHTYLPLRFSESLMEQGTSGTCTGQDSEWSEGSFMLDMMAWDPSIEGFFHIRIVLRSGTIQWHIWDSAHVAVTVGSNS